MPDGSMTTFEEIYNKLVKSGSGALRNLNAREQAQSALVSAIKSLLDKATVGRTDADQYKDQFAKEVAKAIVETEPLEQTFKSAQQLLGTVAGYLEERLLIPARMRAAADGVAGKTIAPTQLAVVQGAVSANALAARTLDEKLLRVTQDFSFRPAVALDSTILFVQKVDAAYNVTITKFDATVRLHTGFSLEKPLTSHANLDAFAGVEYSPRPGVMGYVRATTRVEDVYARPQITGSRIGAGVLLNLAPNATLNLDYSATNVFGRQAHPEQSIFLGIKIRF